MYGQNSLELHLLFFQTLTLTLYNSFGNLDVPNFNDPHPETIAFRFSSESDPDSMHTGLTLLLENIGAGVFSVKIATSLS